MRKEVRDQTPEPARHAQRAEYRTPMPERMRLTRHAPLSTLHKTRFAFRSLLLAAVCLLATACLASGVTDLSGPQGRVVALNNSDLYVISKDDQIIDFYGFRPDTRYEPIFSPDGEAVFYVDLGHRLIRQPLNGGRPEVWLTQVGSPGPGAMTLLPNGQLFLVDTGFNNDRSARFINLSDGRTTVYLTGLNQIFISAAAIKPKSPPVAANIYAAARIEASELSAFQIVVSPITCLIENRQCFFSYTVDAGGLHDNGQMARTYEATLQFLLARRVADDVTSGLLTADGRFLILRARSTVSPDFAQSLYVIDLTTNDPPVPLVENVPRPDYAVSPDGTVIAYEERIEDVSYVRLYNLTTGERTDLGEGTLDPQWWK